MFSSGIGSLHSAVAINSKHSECVKTLEGVTVPSLKKVVIAPLLGCKIGHKGKKFISYEDVKNIYLIYRD